MGRTALSLCSMALGLARPAIAAVGDEEPDAAPHAEPTAMVVQPCGAPAEGDWALAERILHNDWAWLCRYAEENRAVLAAGSPQAVFIGDSITEGWLHADPGFFAHGNLDRGIGGQTSPQLLVRFWQDVVALRPAVVHIMVGTNDLAGNTGLTSALAWRSNIRAMVAIARANGIAVVLGSIPPADRFGWRPGLAPARQIVALNGWLKSYAEESGLAYADYHSALADAGGGLPPALSDDGVHLNPAGYALMRPIAERALAAAMRQQGQAGDR